MSRDLTLADGQLGVTADTIISGADVPSGRVDIVLQNTSTAKQTVTLTFRRTTSGTARRVARAVLEENQQFIVSGLAVQPDDIVLGVSTGAGAVDYLVSASGVHGFAVVSLDGDGSPRRMLTVEAEDDPISVRDEVLREAVERQAMTLKEMLTLLHKIS